MNVKLLVDLLKDTPPDLPVYVWLDGERYQICGIDDTWIDGGHIDINAIRWSPE